MIAIYSTLFWWSLLCFESWHIWRENSFNTQYNQYQHVWLNMISLWLNKQRAVFFSTCNSKSLYGAQDLKILNVLLVRIHNCREQKKKRYIPFLSQYSTAKSIHSKYWLHLHLENRVYLKQYALIYYINPFYVIGL